MDNSTITRRPRSSSSPPSPEQGLHSFRMGQPVSPSVAGGELDVPRSSTARTELVWCTKSETPVETFPALRHTHDRTGRQGIFLLGKTNPGQLLLLPEAEATWEITPFGQSWTQITRVIPPVAGYPEPFAAALAQVILEGRLMDGTRLSWSHWLQHYPPLSSQVFASMPCRICHVTRRLPLFALMSAPSEQATFVCAGASRQCNIENTEVCPWVAWDIPPPQLYDLAENDGSSTLSTPLASDQPPSPHPSQVLDPETTTRLSTRRASDPTNFTTTAIVPRDRSSSRRVGISRSSRTPPRTTHGTRSRHSSRSPARNDRVRLRSSSHSPSPSSSSTESLRSSDSDQTRRRRRRHDQRSPDRSAAFDSFGRSRPKPRHFVVRRELRYFTEAPPTRSEEREAAANAGRSHAKKEQRDFDKWASGFAEALLDGKGEAHRFLNWTEHLKAYFRREDIVNTVTQARLAERTFRGKIARWWNAHTEKHPHRILSFSHLLELIRTEMIPAADPSTACLQWSSLQYEGKPDAFLKEPDRLTDTYPLDHKALIQLATRPFSPEFAGQVLTADTLHGRNGMTYPQLREMIKNFMKTLTKKTKNNDTTEAAEASENRARRRKITTPESKEVQIECPTSKPRR